MSASALRVLDAVKCSRSDLAVPSASSHPLEVMGLKEQTSRRERDAFVRAPEVNGKSQFSSQSTWKVKLIFVFGCDI